MRVGCTFIKPDEVFEDAWSCKGLSPCGPHDWIIKELSAQSDSFGTASKNAWCMSRSAF